MGKKDKKVDEYILKSADFARPILNHLREVVHEACPDVEETMKWSFPHFDYMDEILCSMASFKKHCAFGFWKASIMPDPHQLLQLVGKTAMGSLGQLTDISDLPSDKILKQYIKEAAKLNKAGIKATPRKKTTEKKPVAPPDYLLKALDKNKKAKTTFQNFSDSQKREYIEWMTEAKTEETKLKRLETAIEWMAEGKIRNWKYVKA
jgi:uncharacterized protein YdeI (YjbR/CyaY-like superfamily)